jgi:hypothetical protein
MQDTSNRPAAADRPIPDLLRDLSTEIRTLVTDELALVRLEVTKRGKKAGESAGVFGVAGLFGLGAFFALTLMLVGLLSLAMHIWMASLIVAVVYGVVAGVAAINGKKKLQAIAVRVGVERGR